MRPFSPPFSMAPMAGITDASFRARLRRNGCRTLTTEMMSAAALVRGNRKTRTCLEVPDRGADLSVQLVGAKPDELAEAGYLAQEAGFEAIDFNMGCPVKKVVKTGSGAALLRDRDRAARCLRALRKAVKGTLSIKIRSGWDDRSVNCREVGQLAVDSGVDWVCLHPRTRAQGYAGKADWTLVEDLASALPVPVVGNGDIGSARDAVGRLRATGCAGVMIGRAALVRPWIFREAEALWAGNETPAPPTREEIGHDLMDQLEELARWKGARSALFEMRKFLSWASKGLPGATEFRRRVHRAPGLESLRKQIVGFFGAEEASLPDGARPATQMVRTERMSGARTAIFL